MEAGESTVGAGERENKTGNQTVRRTMRRIAVEKQGDGGRGRGDSATGRRIPAGTTGDVNQWVIRAAVPQEGESRPCILHNSRKEDGEAGWSGFYQRKVDPSSMEMPRSRIIYSSTLDENFRP